MAFEDPWSFFSRWQVYEKVGILGKGSYGTVHFAIQKNPNSLFPRQIAVKSSLFSKSVSLQREAQILRSLRGCTQIVYCYTYNYSFDESGNLLYQLYLEYAPGGTLKDLISKYPGGIPEPEVRSYVRMILKGLSFIHKQGYVHCDIKPGNILVFPSKEVASTNNLKIADFGLAKSVEEVSYTSEGLLNFRGTVRYMSPESVSRGIHKPAMDIWALGCVMVEMVTGQLAWKHKNKVEILHELVFGNGLPDIPTEGLSENGKDFLRRCLERDANQRWTADMLLLLHPFMVEDSGTKDIDELRKLIGPIASKFPVSCSDASMYLRARTWNAKKACKMLKETLKWRLEYKPDKIQWFQPWLLIKKGQPSTHDSYIVEFEWLDVRNLPSASREVVSKEDVAHEAKIRKLYKANYLDKRGRTVLILRPGLQSTSSVEVQIKYLIYCIERAIVDLKPDQEQMVWLINFQAWNMSSISIKAVRETARALQDRYPERLCLAILYNPPKGFESFWLMVKPFLDHKTYKKVNFVFSNNPQSLKIMEEVFDIDKLESSFGGRNSKGFDYNAYAETMKKEDKKIYDSLCSGCSSTCTPTMMSEFQPSDSSLVLDQASDEADHSSSDAHIALSNLEGADDKIEGRPLGFCKEEVGNF